MSSLYNKTERKIIEATLKTLYENGQASTTTRKIAENADVNEVTIFRRFKTKNNLLEKTKEYYLDHVLEEINIIFQYDANEDFNEIFEKKWGDISKFFEDNLILFKVAIEGAFSKKDNQIMDLVSNKIIENLTIMFENAIKNNKIRKINTKVAAFNIYSVIFQSLTLWGTHNNELKVNFNKNLDDFIDIFLNGVLN